MTKYYKITKKDMIPITFKEYEKLPNNERYNTVGPSNTLGENLKEKYLRVDVRHPNGEWERTQ